MANILQLNSKKGLVQLSNDELAELNLLKWIRTSFRGIGKPGFIDEAPFEKIAADLYTQKYPDTQVDMASRCFLDEDNGVTILLKTFANSSNAVERYYNTAENEIVITKHESKQAKFLHRERKKKYTELKKRSKFAIYTGNAAGGQVQVLKQITSDNGQVSYQVGDTKNFVSVLKTKDGEPLINAWPDVKGVDLYPGDTVLLISDFSGFVGNSNLRSPEMPQYNDLISNPESNLYKKFPSSRSNLSDFEKTMLLLGLTSRRKGDIDYTRMFIPDEVWQTKYKSKFNDAFPSYLSLVSFLNETTFSTASNFISPQDYLEDSAQKKDKKDFINNFLGQIDLRDTYINHVPSIMQYSANSKKESDTIKSATLPAMDVPNYLKEGLNYVFNNNVDDPDNNQNNIVFEQLLDALQSKFSESNLKENYDKLLIHLEEVTLNQELNFILNYLTKEKLNASEDNYVDLMNSTHLEEIEDNEDYTPFITDAYGMLPSNNLLVQKYNKILNYLVSNRAISDTAQIQELREEFTHYLSTRHDINNINSLIHSISKDDIQDTNNLYNLEGLIDFIVNFNSVQHNEIKVYKDNLDSTKGVDNITFDKTPYKFINYYISNFVNSYKKSPERKYIKFTNLPKTTKQDALESIGYGEQPMTIDEFITHCPDPRSYENLWITNWNQIPAEDKSKRLNQAFGLNVPVSPDFSESLFGDERSGLRGVDKNKEKALLDFHKYMISTKGADKELNLVSKNRDNNIEVQEARKEFQDWMKNYYNTISNNKSEYVNEITKAKQLLANLEKNDPNYTEQANIQKDIIDYYTNKLQDNSANDYPSWEEYINFLNKNEDVSGSVEGKQSNETRQLVKVLGFTTYEDVTQPNNFDRVKEYVKDYIIDTYNLDSELDKKEIDQLVSAELNHLLLENVKAYLYQEFTSTKALESETELVPPSYDSFRKTIYNIYNKLNINLDESLNIESVKAALAEGKQSKVVGNKEASYLSNLLESISYYVVALQSEYIKEIEKIDDIIDEYNPNAISEEESIYFNQLINSRSQLQEEYKNTKQIESYLLINIPDEVISQYGLLQIDPNLSAQSVNIDNMSNNILEGKLPSKNAQVRFAEENMLSSIDSAYANYLISDEVIAFIHERLPVLGMDKDIKDFISTIAPEVQKEFITQYVNNNSEMFGKGFVEEQDFDAKTNIQDIWAIISIINTSFNSKSDYKEGLLLVTPDQLLKVDTDKIDQFYDKELKAVNQKETKDTFTPYFNTEEEKEKYNKNYNKSIKDYKDTESLLSKQKADKDKTTDYSFAPEGDINNKDKYKQGPIDNYKTQLYRYRKELENLPSVKKDRERLEEIDNLLNTNSQTAEEAKQLQNERNSIINYIEPIEKKQKLYEKKIDNVKKKIDTYKPQYGVNEKLNDKKLKLKKDIEEFNILVNKYNKIKENSNTSAEEIQRWKDSLIKRKNIIDMQKNDISELQKQVPGAKQANLYHNSILKSYRKLHSLNTIFNSLEEQLLNTYIKVAAKEPSYDTYSEDGSYSSDSTNKGKNIDLVSGKMSSNVETFENLLEKELKKLSSYENHDYFNDNQQTTTEMLDGDVDDNYLDSDVSSIKGKRISTYITNDDVKVVQAVINNILTKNASNFTSQDISNIELYIDLESQLTN